MSNVAYNPLEIIMDVMNVQEMSIQHISNIEVSTELQGHWGFYKMQFYWQENLSVLHINVLFELSIGNSDKSKLNTLISILNERLIIGHFEIFIEEDCPAFRYSMITVSSAPVSFELIEETISIILDECEGCFPAFKSLIDDNADPHQAALTAVMDTMGEA